MSKVWIVISYEINHDFIVKYLCEKRDQPKNECDGKCWLRNELNKTEDESTKQIPRSKTDIPEDTYICRGEACKMKVYPANGCFSYGSYQNQGLSSGIIEDVFHPPRLKSV